MTARKREPFAQIPHELWRGVFVAEGPRSDEPWLEVDVVENPERGRRRQPLAPLVPLDVDGTESALYGLAPFDDLTPHWMAPDWMRNWETTGWEFAEEMA
jgi:hypothetical protein